MSGAVVEAGERERKGLGGKLSYAWGVRGLRALAERADHGLGRRRRADRPIMRRDGRERTLPRQRHEDVPGGRPVRRTLRRAPDRGHLEARPRGDAAEDLRGRTFRIEGRVAPRQEGHHRVGDPRSSAARWRATPGRRPRPSSRPERTAPAGALARAGRRPPRCVRLGVAEGFAAVDERAEVVRRVAVRLRVVRLPSAFSSRASVT